MEEQIVSLLGGRVAEKLMLGDISTGASNDIQRASQIARKMVSVYGMSDRLGSISFESGHDEIFIGRSMAQAKPYSEQVAAQIDEEVKSIIDAAYERCEDILSRDQKHLIAVAEFLLAHETMSAEEFEAVFTDEAAGMTKSNPAMNKISHQQAAGEIFFHIFARIPAFSASLPLPIRFLLL